ncbi:unnamed protein product, partial [Amoebophrya sp. A25]|eukprot:GSA25T00010394001.1
MEAVNKSSVVQDAVHQDAHASDVVPQEDHRSRENVLMNFQMFLRVMEKPYQRQREAERSPSKATPRMRPIYPARGNVTRFSNATASRATATLRGGTNATRGTNATTRGSNGTSRSNRTRGGS